MWLKRCEPNRKYANISETTWGSKRIWLNQVKTGFYNHTVIHFVNRKLALLNFAKVFDWITGNWNRVRGKTPVDSRDKPKNFTQLLKCRIHINGMLQQTPCDFSTLVLFEVEKELSNVIVIEKTLPSDPLRLKIHPKYLGWARDIFLASRLATTRQRVRAFSSLCLWLSLSAPNSPCTSSQFYSSHFRIHKP